MGFLEDDIDEALRVEREFTPKPKPVIQSKLTTDVEKTLISGVLNMTATRLREANDKWWRDPATGEIQVRNRGEQLMLMVSEIAEALEGNRKDLMDSHLPHRKAEVVELADLFIRLMDYVGEYFPGEFGYAVVEKLAYNETRKDHTNEARLAPGGKKY